MKIELTPLEARVIGCLMEKEVTTPEQYPLSLNALTNACNQKSNRDPLLDLDEATVQQVVDGLLKKHLVSDRSGYGGRVPKYKQVFCNTEFGPLQFTDIERAIICELLLRGPQSAGELRTRCNRMTRIADVGEVDAALDALGEHAAGPFVVRLPRAPGARDARYAHLLSGDVPVAQASAAAPEPAPSRPGLAERVERLESEVEGLRRELDEIRGQGKQGDAVMRFLKNLLDNNRTWAERIRAQDPEFFAKLSRQQSPEYLWIGCSDSRVPANQIVGLLPGRDLRAPQRRQRRGAHRPQLPVGAAVRGRRAEGEARHRLRPLRLRRRAVRAAQRPARPDRQLAAPRPGRAAASTCAMMDSIAGRARQSRPAVRAQRHRAGGQRLPDDRRAGRLGARPGASPSTAGSTASADGLLRDLKVCVTGQDELVPVYDEALARLSQPPEPGAIGATRG